jgi:MFS family permease
VGRVGFGYLGDRYSKRIVLAGGIAMLSFGLALLATASTLWVAMLAIGIAAPGFGGTIPLRPSMAADYFGTRNFGTINGTMQFLSTTGGAAGPWVVGRIVDVEGDYTMGWVIAAIVVAVVGVPAALAATAPSKLRAEHRPAPRIAPS